MTKIEWTDEVWNPLVGCSKVSAGCAHCYAERMANRLRAMAQADQQQGRNPGRKSLYLDVVDDSGKWTGKVNIDTKALSLPLSWKAPRKIFVNSMSDLFHESVSFEFIAAVYGVLQASKHVGQILTKSTERAAGFYTWLRERSFTQPTIGPRWSHEASYCCRQAMKAIPGWGHILNLAMGQWPVQNIWLGTSVENQPAAEARIPHLLRCPAAVRFLSCEPLLGPVDFRAIKPLMDAFNQSPYGWHNWLRRQLHWVIVGGESGPHARPMHPDWSRSLRDQCAAAGVPFFFKQWGEWSPIDEPWKQESPSRLKDNEQWLNLAGGSGFHGEEVWRMRRVGKQAAGRLLDGQEWNMMPEVPHGS